MNLVNKISRFQRGMSITTKFGLGIVLMLFLIMMVAATGYRSMEFVRDAEESIQMSAEIQRLVLEMDRGMEKARRLHADFFLQYPKIGLSKAHELYAQPSVRETAQVISVSNALKNLLTKSKMGGALQKRRVDLNLYLSSAKRFADTSIQSVELVTELAAPERGLEARLDDQLSELHAAVAGDDKLEHLYDDMRSFVQDYRITRKRFLMQSAFNVAFSMREQLSKMRGPDPGKVERINHLLDTCMSTAEAILGIDVAIKSKFNDFALQNEAVDAVSTTLVQLAKEEVNRAQARITHAHKIAILLMAVITLAGLIAAVVIAKVLHDSITRRVVHLTASAGELRKGNLDVFAEEEGMDELSQLARTFNVMAARMRELIDNLEQKVELRTAELAASERRFRELFEHSSSGVAVYEPSEDGQDFIFKDINKAAERMEGVKREDVLDKRVTEVFPGVRESGLFEVFRTVWRTGQPVLHPASLYCDDRLCGWRESSVFRVPSGEIVAIYDDLTSQKQAEIEKRNMEARLQRAQKMETIGLLAGGVAHDLNNILSGIVGYPELLLLQLPEDSELRESIKAIQESGQRASAVVADLLTVARGVACAKTTASLNGLVTGYLNSPEYLKLKASHDRIDCVTNLDPGLFNIDCSPIHVRKSLMNLVMNAMEAIEGSGRILISTCNRRIDEKMAWENGIKAGDYAVLSVRDDGKGIPAKDLEHIFEPFYTKKIMGRSGTGLGLAVVWNSVMDHLGTVLVESSPNGTCFELCFPASRQEVVIEERNAVIEDLKGTGEAILVVDDEPQQLDIASRMLKVLGYQVACAASGEEAIDYVKENCVDLVLLDMLMEPGINGRETYERIVEIQPKQKAVISSGFSESEDVYHAHHLGARGFIKKPYSLEQLGRIVKEEINR